MCDIVYKACGEYIVELKRLPDTITNEYRDDVVDSRYAKFRGNKFLVHSIKHKITNEHIYEIENTVFSDKKIKYIVGKEVSTEFCKNLNEICTKGIHFFTSFEAAYYYIYISNRISSKEWYDNGQQSIFCNYKDGVHHGEYNEWYKNGKQSKKCNYIDGNIVGEYNEWHNNGKQSKKCTFNNGKLCGEYNEWSKNGKQTKKCNLNNGKIVGEYKEWYKNGQQLKICNYIDGKLDGEYKEWYKNGQVMLIRKYIDGKLEGEERMV